MSTQLPFNNDSTPDLTLPPYPENSSSTESYLDVYELANISGLHVNTIRDRCKVSDESNQSVKTINRKRAVEIKYAVSKLTETQQEHDELLTKINTFLTDKKSGKSQQSANNASNFELIQSYKEQVDRLSNQLLGFDKMLTNQRIDFNNQLTKKDEQINKLLDELGQARNQFNSLHAMTQQIQKSTLAIEENSQKKKGIWPFNR